jgi:lactate dehydrogenase-like 2-hydroxyacid dehydrogenase
MTIEILQTGPLLASCEQALTEKYTVHKLHEQADKAAWLMANGARIRAHAGSGVQADLMDALPNLEIISSFGVGYDNIDTASAKAKNHPRHQYARRAQRRCRGTDDRPDDRACASPAAGRSVRP